MNVEELHAISVVLLAGGQGTRLGTSLPKQFIPIHQKPLWYYSAATFHATFTKARWILVFPKIYHEAVRKDFQRFFPDIVARNIQLVEGGETRFHSVANALPHCDKTSFVFIHDAARCFVSRSLLERLYQCVVTKKTAIPSIPMRDSVRIEEGHTPTSIDRTKLRLIQTPQVFSYDILERSYAQQAYQEKFSDDASVVESAGFPLHWVSGEYSNFKITFAEDIPIAEKLLSDFHP